ncbi:uncharacterized protein MYCFIDRAFT_177619 [Pseudocercospora fijiensis CIRAD86]|uniref:Uncharacterized protein n=1 Tax=Pseudocercospora fijiensis (strain CIRAD86) TaxID=383855 RepID=M2ZNL3_PSEFD|nr:uncharacterized protein MYCFIDRAFT_177619 [Pseudocercospora fijiensis CIRAD86]EME80684.1 hypothetical protein MYCFIDRAFT_177619 [Pseudocercospora fijiensis CIRAD86]
MKEAEELSWTKKRRWLRQRKDTVSDCLADNLQGLQTTAKTCRTTPIGLVSILFSMSFTFSPNQKHQEWIVGGVSMQRRLLFGIASIHERSIQLSAIPLFSEIDTPVLVQFRNSRCLQRSTIQLHCYTHTSTIRSSPALERQPFTYSSLKRSLFSNTVREDIKPSHIISKASEHDFASTDANKQPPKWTLTVSPTTQETASQNPTSKGSRWTVGAQSRRAPPSLSELRLAACAGGMAPRIVAVPVYAPQQPEQVNRGDAGELDDLYSDHEEDEAQQTTQTTTTAPQRTAQAPRPAGKALPSNGPPLTGPWLRLARRTALHALLTTPLAAGPKASEAVEAAVLVLQVTRSVDLVVHRRSRQRLREAAILTWYDAEEMEIWATCFGHELNFLFPRIDPFHEMLSDLKESGGFLTVGLHLVMMTLLEDEIEWQIGLMERDQIKDRRHLLSFFLS